MHIRTPATMLMSALVGTLIPNLAVAQSQSFTYQGELRDGNTLAQGPHDLRFEILDEAGSVLQLLCADNVPVTDGRFTALLDPGEEFPNLLQNARSIRVLVRPDTGLACEIDGGFVALSPTQPFTRSPLATRATLAERAGAADTASVANSLAGFTPSYFTNAANLTGTVPDALLSTNVPRLNESNSFSGTNYFSAISTSTILFPGLGGGLRMSQNGGAITTISGAASNLATPLAIGSSVTGGSGNSITDAPNSFIGGGTNSSITSSVAVPTSNAVIGGGAANNVAGYASTVGGGLLNTTTNEGATVAGGHRNEARARFATISGGGPSTNSDATATNNRVHDAFGTIGGGGNNRAGDDLGTAEDRPFATVSGGRDNRATQEFSTVGGGSGNRAATQFGTVGGGVNNTAGGGGFATIAGGSENDATGFVAAVAGGDFNNASGDRSFIGGGNGNIASGSGSAAVSGFSNRSEGFTSFVGGGDLNIADGDRAVLGGGYTNRASGSFATLSGGIFNQATAYGSTVVGGDANLATGQWSSVLGGIDNQATALGAFAGGFRARAIHEGSLVWSDRSDLGGSAVTTSTAPNQVTLRAAGGVRVIGNVNVSGNINYATPRLTYRMYSVGAFTPGTRSDVDVPVRIGFNRELIAGPAGSTITFHVALDLPNNARIRQIDVFCNDLDPSRHMRFAVLGTNLPAQTSSILVERTTEGLAGSQLTVGIPIPTPILVDNINRALEFFVQPERPVSQGVTIEWSGSLQIAGMRIGYESDGPAQ